MRTVTTTQFLCHLRNSPIYIDENQTKSHCSTVMFGMSISDLEQARIAKIMYKAGYLDVEEIQFGKKKTLKYNLNDMGRTASRGDEQTLTLEMARALHDVDLSDKWGDHSIAKQVLLGRGLAAQQLRLVLACTYAKDGACTHAWWSVIPCLTTTGTIGILDIAAGTAWDTGVMAHKGVHDLGLVGEVYAAANGIAGDCYIDNKLVQRDGTSVVDGQVVPPKMPPGWQQIGLPTWRGYDPNANRYTNVPEGLFRPELWIRPTLVASGLMTCYGTPGTNNGEWLKECHGWESAYPWGIPSWINGESVTLWDTFIDTLQSLGVFEPFHRSRLSRESDDEELRFLWAMYDVMLREFAPKFAARLTEWKNRKPKYGSSIIVRKGLKEAAEAMAEGRLPSAAADQALITIGNENSHVGLPPLNRLRAAFQALTEELPHAAAVHLACAAASLGY